MEMFKHITSYYCNSLSALLEFEAINNSLGGWATELTICHWEHPENSRIYECSEDVPYRKAMTSMEMIVL